VGLITNGIKGVGGSQCDRFCAAACIFANAGVRYHETGQYDRITGFVLLMNNCVHHPTGIKSLSADLIDSPRITVSY
jgi:hypothetical protein